MLRPALLALVLSLALGAAAPGVAAAQAEKTVTWEPARVFPTAVRFLRIDAGVKIVEKDAEAGYILFELDDEGKTYPGALELIEVDTGGERPALRLVLRIEDRPDWMEVSMLDKLERKLRSELGPPPRIEKRPKEPPKEPPKAPDAPSGSP